MAARGGGREVLSRFLENGTERDGMSGFPANLITAVRRKSASLLDKFGFGTPGEVKQTRFQDRCNSRSANPPNSFTATITDYPSRKRDRNGTKIPHTPPETSMPGVPSSPNTDEPSCILRLNLSKLRAPIVPKSVVGVPPRESQVSLLSPSALDVSPRATGDLPRGRAPNQGKNGAPGRISRGSMRFRSTGRKGMLLQGTVTNIVLSFGDRVTVRVTGVDLERMWIAALVADGGDRGRPDLSRAGA